MIVRVELVVPADGATPEDEESILELIKKRGFSPDLGVAERNFMVYANVGTITKHERSAT